ncbi:MAG: adenylate/guanylate cyclase domain-containing protein [Candidatus Tectomicrobia bacterium]
MARLKIVEGCNIGKSFPLAREIILGRDAESDINVPDSRVSRHHARIIQQTSGYALEDLNSSNGTTLGGERIAPNTSYTLSPGDEIRIGSTLLVFFTDSTDVDAAPRQDEESPRGQQHRTTPQAVKVERDSEIFAVRMLEEDTAYPSVAMSLDASANMMVVDEDEKSTNKGLHDALKRLQAMCQVSTALGTITDQAQLMEKITDCIFHIFPGAERSFILLRQRDGETLVPVVARIRPGTEASGEEMAISRTMVQEVTAHKRSILSVDALDDNRFNQHMSVINLAIRSMMCAPLLVGDEMLGLIHVDTKTGGQYFSSEDLQILTGISAQAAIAVKNTQLYEMIEIEVAQRTSLQRYFSPKMVEMLMSGDVTTALGGNSYNGTVLFADIIGFTAMSETLSPVDVMTKLNRYFTIMQGLIYENGGNVDKFNGDGIMAFWGIPHAEEQDEFNAVLTTLQMQKHLWLFNLDLEAEWQQPIHMGVGLNSGEFVAGNVGSKDKIEFTLIGDNINLAARIENLAGRYQVLVAKSTWQHIRHLVFSVQLPEVIVKGKSRPITVYSIRGLLHPQSGCFTMALPCSLLDAEGHQVGRGILIGGKFSNTGLHLQFNTDEPLLEGSMVVLQMAMTEYHEPVVLSAEVHRSVLAGTQEGMSTYTQAVLTNLQGEDAVAFLQAGSCLRTAYSWNELRRI